MLLTWKKTGGARVNGIAMETQEDIDALKGKVDRRLKAYFNSVGEVAQLLEANDQIAKKKPSQICKTDADVALRPESAPTNCRDETSPTTPLNATTVNLSFKRSRVKHLLFPGYKKT